MTASQEPLTAPAVASTWPHSSFAGALRRGRARREELLRAEGGVLGSRRMRDELKLHSRDAVEVLRQQHKLLALPVAGRGDVYPRWQVKGGKILPGLSEVLQALADRDPWMQAIFLLGHNYRLGGEQPLALLRTGKAEDRARVLDAAAVFGEQGAL